MRLGRWCTRRTAASIVSACTVVPLLLSYSQLHSRAMDTQAQDFLSPRLVPPLDLEDTSQIRVLIRHPTPLIEKGSWSCRRGLQCRIEDWTSTPDAWPVNAILFDRRQVSPDALPHRKPLNQAWILFSSETPLYDELDGAGPPKEYAAFWRLFDLSSTYRLDSTIPFPYFRRWVWPSIQRISAARARNQAAPIVWVVSNCESWTDRETYVKELQRHVPVHVYGHCLSNMPWPTDDEGKPITLHQLLMRYKFYLAFENTNCIDYCTEKLFHSYILGLVPIVMGCRGLHQFFQPAAISPLHVDDFRTPLELAKKVLQLHQNDTAYQQYHTWRSGGPSLSATFLRLWNGTVGQSYECRVCAAVQRFHQELEHHPLSTTAVNPDFSCDESSDLREKRCPPGSQRPLCIMSSYTFKRTRKTWGVGRKERELEYPHRVINY